MSNSENPKKESSENPESGAPKLPMRSLAVWLLLLALFVTMYQVFSPSQQLVQRMDYKPDFVLKLDEGKVKNVEVVIEGPAVQYLKGELTELDEVTGKFKKFRVDVLITDRLEQELYDKVENFSYKPGNPYLKEFLMGAVPFIIVLALLYFLFIRQMKSAGKGAMSFGKSRAKLLTRNKNRITFNEVAGIEEAKEEVEEIVDFLKDPKKYQKLGGRIPKGVLLVGPPGTGKTLLAKAIAGEADVPFFSISGSDFVEMFVGVGASRVRDMFEQGKKNAPCIIFIDEIDAVGRSRFSGIGGGHDEREQTLNALLVEMDGFETQEGVIIIAATNRADVLDPALLRPGRFDRQIRIDLPSLEGRTAILGIHSDKIKLAEELELKRIARGTPGFSGADLANLMNEGALMAARRGAEAVEISDLEDARDKVAFGTERKSLMLDKEEIENTAYHEAGHAIVMECLEGCEPVHKVSVIPRGSALGVTMSLPEKDQYTYRKSKLIAQIVSLMGGRAAEEIVFEDVTTGASNDLQRASQMIRAMITKFGMSEANGLQSFSDDGGAFTMGPAGTGMTSYSEKTAEAIDAEVTQLLDKYYNQAKQILIENRDALNIMAKELLERETIDGIEVTEIVRFKRILNDDDREELHPEALVKFAEPVKEELVEESSDESSIESSEEEDTPPFSAPETNPA